jgi:flagellar biosynthesis/type III secretory pathway ATPase
MCIKIARLLLWKELLVPLAQHVSQDGHIIIYRNHVTKNEYEAIMITQCIYRLLQQLLQR